MKEKMTSVWFRALRNMMRWEPRTAAIAPEVLTLGTAEFESNTTWERWRR